MTNIVESVFMKKVLFSFALCLCAVCAVQGQTIQLGDRFYDGFTLYTVREVRPGNIVYMSDALGDEELTLEQWGDSPRCYRLLPSRNAEEPKYGAEFGCRVNYVCQPDNKYLEVIGDNDYSLQVLPLVQPMDEMAAGGLWYNGSLVYDARPDKDGSVRMTAMAEGEEHEFLLIPVGKGTDLFEVSGGPDGAVNVYDHAAYARRIRQDGLDVICFYDKLNRLTDVMQATQIWDAQELNVRQWMALLCGKYKTEGGADVVMEESRFEYKGMEIPMKPVTFNGMATGVLDFGDAGPFPTGLIEAVPTREGLLFTEVRMEDGAAWFERTVSCYALEWAGGQSRFAFTRDILLIGVLHRCDKQLLRVMRNAILAAHGYVFRSKDLKTYFEAQPWYHPAANKAGIKLSLLEHLNIALIQAAERRE